MQRVVMMSALCMSICFAQEKPIILWDLHDVIFKQKNPIAVIAHYPYLRQVVSYISWPLVKDLIYELIANVTQQKSTEDYFRIIRKHNNPYLEELIIHVANTMQVIPTMDHLVHELAALGYTQHIGSNIGPRAFKKLIDPQLHPEFESLFDQFNIPASQVAQWQDGKLIRKPDQHYFQLYLEKNNLNPFYNHIIFIDENQRNIQAAQNLGLIPFYLRIRIKYAQNFNDAVLI